jgi:hypothetical protein
MHHHRNWYNQLNRLFQHMNQVRIECMIWILQQVRMIQVGMLFDWSLHLDNNDLLYIF